MPLGMWKILDDISGYQICRDLFSSAISPIWYLQQIGEQNATHAPDFVIVDQDFSAGQLGRVALFAPSGVAASHCNGYTFHNGLRSKRITLAQLRGKPSSEIIKNHAKDFARVLCIEVDESSTTSVLLIAYFDKILRRVRPAFSQVLFGRLPIISTGVAFPLPVILAFVLLSNEAAIPEEL